MAQWINEIIIYMHESVCFVFTIVFTLRWQRDTQRVYGIYFYQLIFFFFCFFVVFAHLFITTFIKAIIGEHNEMKWRKNMYKYEMSIELMAIWQGAIAIIVHINSGNVNVNEKSVCECLCINL